MKRRNRRPVEIFSLSFLDVVSCGFGAIILLLVMVKVAEPRVVEQISADLSALLSQRQGELAELEASTASLEQALRERKSELKTRVGELESLLARLMHLQKRQRGEELDLQAQRILEQQFELARQQLSEEQQRLRRLTSHRSTADSPVGGIAVDSEYIVFIIDTSGSMQKYAWRLVLRKLSEVLKVYPRVKGIQVMNDMGDYMFPQYAGKWIPDSPARRRAILKRLAGWAPFSNSSPVEGIEAAIRRFHTGDKKISLYIFGDDFSRGSIEAVVDTVDQLNRSDASGKRRVRINAVGFPVLFQHAQNATSAVRFAALMRKLAETNGGSFVGLNDTQPRARSSVR